MSPCSYVVAAIDTEAVQPCNNNNTSRMQLEGMTKRKIDDCSSLAPASSTTVTTTTKMATSTTSMSTSSTKENCACPSPSRSSSSSSSRSPSSSASCASRKRMRSASSSSSNNNTSSSSTDHSHHHHHQRVGITSSGHLNNSSSGASNAAALTPDYTTTAVTPDQPTSSWARCLKAAEDAKHAKKQLGDGDSNDDDSSDSISATNKKRKNSDDVIDIDCTHKDKLEACTELINDMIQFRMQQEKDSRLRSCPQEFTAAQVDFIPDDRLVLVDWICFITERYGMQPATLGLAVSLMDRTLAKLTISTRVAAEALAASCVFLAAKMEEVRVPSLSAFQEKLGDKLTISNILELEARVCKVLSFRLHSPHLFTFLPRWKQAAGIIAGTEEAEICNYIAELALANLNCQRHSPSLLAAAVVNLTRRIVGKEAWSATLEHYTKFSDDDVNAVAKELGSVHRQAENTPIRWIWWKYSRKERQQVAINVTKFTTDADFALAAMTSSPSSPSPSSSSSTTSPSAQLVTP